MAHPGADPELPPDDDADNSDARPATEQEKSARSPNGLHEFREKRWSNSTEKDRRDDRRTQVQGVPVLWVGLPAVRGPKATADTAFLDTLYRDAAGKAGIAYVDVWDGFVDDAGRFSQQGPDFEGQIRRLRSSDGVYFTKAGALKLAHYAEREINGCWLRVRADCAAHRNGNPRRQCAAGSAGAASAGRAIVPPVASSVGNGSIARCSGSRSVTMDAQAARLLIKGEPLPAPPVAPTTLSGRGAK